MTIGTTPALGHTRERRVVIVGGGLAGISAAETLACINANLPENERLQITLLEARRVTGGRAGSFVDPITGQPVDYCQHVAMGCCTNLLELLRRSGLIDCWQPYRELTFYHPQHGFSLFRPSRWMPAPLHLDAAINGLRFLGRTEKRQIKCALWRLIRTPVSDLRHQTAAEWLREQGQDDSLRKRFWDVILVSALGDQPERVSMGAARKVLVDGFAAARGASNVWVPRETLSNVFGSSMIEWLQGLGADVQVGRIVQSLTPNTERESGASLNLSVSESMPADQVILAMPWRATKRLLSTLGEAVLDQGSRESSELEMKHSPITGLHLWFDRPLTAHDQAVMVGTISQWLFREPVTTKANDGVYHQVVISGEHELSDESKKSLVTSVVNELRVAFPDARDAKLLRSRVVTDPQAVFSLSPELQAWRPNAPTSLPWLHLAGDWVQTGWPATMEGAVISGKQAVESVCKSLELRPEQILPHTTVTSMPRGWLARRLIVD